MNCIIRPLELEDEPFLWEMLYQAIHVPEGQTPLPRKIIQIPELARYVQSWGREGDYTSELSIAVLPEYLCQGVGTQLLTHLFASDYGKSSISLNVSADNPAARLYERFGFEIISRSDRSLTIKRN